LYGLDLYGGVLPGYTVYLRVVPSPFRLGVPVVHSSSSVRLLSERPPLRLSMNIQTPDGNETRWSSSEVNPLKVHQGLTFTTTMPGGYEHCDVTLIRDPRRAFHDLVPLTRITIQGVGGDVAWLGRIETTPSVSGDQLALTPGAVGYQGALSDDSSCREIYVDQNLSVWQGPSLNRQTYAAVTSGTKVPNGASGAFDLEAGGVQPNPTDAANAYAPALDTHFLGSWARTHASEAWYDAQGIPIGKLDMKLTPGAIFGGSISSPWGCYGYLVTDDAFATTTDGVTWTADTVTTNYDGTSFSAPGHVILNASGGHPSRIFACVMLYYVTTSTAGTQGVDYPVFWSLAVYGTRGIPIQPDRGVLGSDALKDCIPRYAPELNITKQGISTIAASTFSIPQLVFTSAGTVADIVKAVSSFEINDWGVWDGDQGNPTFFWRPRTTSASASNTDPLFGGRKWRSRTGPARLAQTGPQIDHLYNGVVVNFADFAGISRQVGPPGSNCTYTDASLADSDPTNPINQWGQGLHRYAQLNMSGPSTVAVATAFGAVYLQEQKLRNSSGSAQISGYIEDDAGVVWPAYVIKAGDRIAFIDAADSSYRRIVSTSYADESKINSLTLDTPPDTLQAILARYQSGLAQIVGA